MDPSLGRQRAARASVSAAARGVAFPSDITSGYASRVVWSTRVAGRGLASSVAAVFTSCGGVRSRVFHVVAEVRRPGISTEAPLPPAASRIGECCMPVGVRSLLAVVFALAVVIWTAARKQGHRCGVCPARRDRRRVELLLCVCTAAMDSSRVAIGGVVWVVVGSHVRQPGCDAR